LKTDYVNIT